mgnify:CR=1 FL=1
MSSSVQNLGGPFGAYLSDFLFSITGFGAYLILLILSFVAIRQLFFYQPKQVSYKIIKICSALILTVTFSSLCEYYFSGDLFPQDSSGGIIGAFVFTNLTSVFGIAGSLIFIFIFFFASISITFSFSWLALFDAIGKYFEQQSSAYSYIDFSDHTFTHFCAFINSTRGQYRSSKESFNSFFEHLFGSI